MISDVALGSTKTLPERLLPLQSLRELVLLQLFRGFVLDEHLLLLLGFALTTVVSARSACCNGCFTRAGHNTQPNK